MKTTTKVLLVTALVAAIVLSAVTELGLSLKAGDKVYILSLNYDSGNVGFTNVSIGTGFAPSRNIHEGGDYRVDILSMENRSLYSFWFSFPFILTSTGERQTYDKTSLLIPYFSNGKEIGVYDANGIQKLSIDLTQFAEGECFGDLDCDDRDICTADACSAQARTCSHTQIAPCCGNGMCETGENSSNCQLDCPVQSGVQSMGVASAATVAFLVIVVIAIAIFASMRIL